VGARTAPSPIVMFRIYVVAKKRTAASLRVNYVHLKSTNLTLIALR